LNVNLPVVRFIRLGALLLALGIAPVRAAEPVLEFRGLANASAAVRVGEDRFLAGCDENNVLQLYRNTGGNPQASFETSPWLGLTTRNGEADFEGAARLGDVVFWLGSHGRNKSGEKRPDRQRLLAVRVVEPSGGGSVRLEPVGEPVMTLVEQMAAASTLTRFGLAEASRRPPEEPGGLNLEGLAAGPGDSLWLGFRNPVPEGKALLVPLENPLEVIAGRPARFGEPQLLELGGRGIRDLVWTGRDYFMIGGAAGGGGKSQLYRWAGEASAPVPVGKAFPKSLNPEALVVFGSAESPRLLVLSDDGGRSANETWDFARRTFRAVWVTP
jgi:hypothetical protein